MTSSRLDRIRKAQDSAGSFDSALTELTTSGKRGHWIWYVLPQLEGLGTSTQSQAFAIRDLGEGIQYLLDPVLRSRLLAVTRVVARALDSARSLEALMGSRVDALKTVSSLTLFEVAARSLQGERPEGAAGEELAEFTDLAARSLSKAEEQGYPRCEFTLRRLARDSRHGVSVSDWASRENS